MMQIFLTLAMQSLFDIINYRAVVCGLTHFHRHSGFFYGTMGERSNEECGVAQLKSCQAPLCAQAGCMQMPLSLKCNWKPLCSGTSPSRVSSTDRKDQKKYS